MAHPFDHGLKLNRALDHLMDLKTKEEAWLNGDHHSVRHEIEPQGTWLFLATAQKPPHEQFSPLVGDCLHNLRSALDNLAFALASVYTKPLPDDFANSSEFPIFGDEDRDGNTGVGCQTFHRRIMKGARRGEPGHGSGLHKIRGWHPDAQAIVELLQPYHRGNAFRSDPLWIIHELDRIDKHRLLHAVVGRTEGIRWDPRRSVNVAGVPDGLVEVFGATVETDTPIARFPGPIPIDRNQDMHMEIHPGLSVAFAQGTPCVEYEPVLKTLAELGVYVRDKVFAPLQRFL